MTSLAQKFRDAAPTELIELCERLRSDGHRAVVVGGSVRDLLMGRDVADWDVATSARPEQVEALFDRTTLLHARHGTSQVRIGDRSFEVTTFRIDGPYGDGRHPDFVRLTDRLEDDLARRDFTVNAIALDPYDAALIDPHDGSADILARRIRAVGDPSVRFREDALRMLRAARLAGVLGFDVDPAILQAMRTEGALLSRIAAERVREELMKMMGAERPSVSIRILADTGLLDIVLPELSAAAGVTQNEYHAHDVLTHSLVACDHAPRAKPLVRLAALLHDVGKVPARAVREGRTTFYDHERIGAAMVRRRLHELRFPNREVEHVAHLVERHMFHYEPEWTDAAVRRFVARAGVENLPDLFDLRYADSLAKGPEGEAPADLEELKRRIRRERERESAFTVRDLAVSGDDLMSELGIGPGPDVGRLLRELLMHVIDHDGTNTREALLARAREIAERRT
jgi:poly(A) polymerase/tRNA nucleotidyltransferase (CCA-adding enzyme)